MEISYWQSRWQKGKTGWHMDQVYPPLPQLWPRLSLTSRARVLVPLCGKSMDLLWLAEQGFRVIGVDVSEKALQEFINSCPETFTRSSEHNFTIFRSKHIELWQGDFMKLPDDIRIDAVYDKAALVALPPDKRGKYARKVKTLCGRHAKILLQSFEYKQEEMNGPPFSVDKKEIEQLFGQLFSIQLLHKQSKLEELSKFRNRGLYSYLFEKVYLLEPRQ